MYALGLDIGSSTVKLVLLKDGVCITTWHGPVHGGPAQALQSGLLSLPLPQDEPLSVCCVDAGAQLFASLPDFPVIGVIPAVAEGVRRLVPEAGCIVEIGSQSARFITNLQEQVPEFAVNEHCAGGTGSFFEDQMTRLGMKIEDFSDVVETAGSIPRISGRCAVFAKSDIVHRQQEGSTSPDILLGLCYAMVRNYRATVVRSLPVKKPLVFCGGVTQNRGVIRALREVFDLSEDELVIPDLALYAGALGAARAAEDAAAGNAFTLSRLLAALETAGRAVSETAALKPLSLSPAQRQALTDPAATGVIPAEGCYLGIDIGSTSTDLVLTDGDGTLIDFQYLRTAGDPERAVRSGLAEIRRRFGEVKIRGAAVTGSGRERIGRLIGADVVRDEITAQARGAAACVPEADTVFEIGGQDSKFIRLKDGRVTDFQMNKICAAGTGSFVEEQAARMGLPLDVFGELALAARAPAALGERCTVFIETAISTALANGTPQEDICAGLCCSIVRNYLHKVVGNRPVGSRIVLQGGVAYNPGIVAAFEAACGGRIKVNPYFSISGAYGAALLAAEAVGTAPSRFKGYDFPSAGEAADAPDAAVQKNTAFYRRAGELLMAGYTGGIDPAKKTVGIPYVLMIHRFFPMANAFFQALGFNVLLTDPTDEETIRLSQLAAQGETCYPVKLIYGHMQQLIDRKADYIFLPTIRTIKHETSRVVHNYSCVYMQTAAVSIARALGLQEKGITLLSPVFDLDFGQQAMAQSMVGLAKLLGRPASQCREAMMAGFAAVRRHTAAMEQQGKELLASIRPEDRVLVMITRNYGVSDPVLNMGIPERLLERGCKVITLSHLPGHALDISPEYPNLYWPFGQHIISGAKLIARHPNLYAVYLTNHGCGPDTMLAHLFKREMGDKPCLQIEVDEHFSPVGVITRIEAFLASLASQPAVQVPPDFEIMNVPIRPTGILAQPKRDLPLFLPALGAYGPFMEAYYRQAGFDARLLPPLTDQALALGRAETGSKEYLPFTALLGNILAARQQADEPAQYLVPQTLGAETDGVYAQAISAILEEKGLPAAVAAPTIELLPASAIDRDALFRAVTAGDLLYAAPAGQREVLTAAAKPAVPSWEELTALAEEIGRLPVTGRRIAAVGTPLCLTDLDDGILELLEAEGDTVLRAPLSEYLWMLWQDNGQDPDWLSSMAERLEGLGAALGARSPFSPALSRLTEIADAALPRFAGGNGRYRYAKACESGSRTAAVLLLEPRYENTSMILDMRNLKAACPAPLLLLSLDRDLDDAALSRLRSFLYYC